MLNVFFKSNCSPLHTSVRIYSSGSIPISEAENESTLLSSSRLNKPTVRIGIAGEASIVEKCGVLKYIISGTVCVLER